MFNCLLILFFFGTKGYKHLFCIGLYYTAWKTTQLPWKHYIGRSNIATPLLLI
jgi:hypothetical protein